MPNPFPGMDPYLEGPNWSTVHFDLIGQIAWQLAPKIQPKYRAFTNSQVILASLDPLEIPRVRLRLPDVGIYDKGAATATGPTATAAAPLKLMAVMPETIEQKVLEIRESESDALVTAIEVLSPTNKRGDGLIEFQQKRREYLAGPAHYMEIDLLRIGKRFPIATTLPSVPYFIFLSRADQRPCVDTWQITLDQPPCPRFPFRCSMVIPMSNSICSRLGVRSSITLATIGSPITPSVRLCRFRRSSKFGRTSICGKRV